MMHAVVADEIDCPDAMPIYAARPRDAGRYPVIILMHERYGLVTHPRDLARRCAEEGFFACAPNFFFKHPDQKALNAGDVRYDMSDPESILRLNAVFAMLEKHASADMSKTAIAGFCQTGRYPLIFAAEKQIQAAVVWYGAASKREWAITETQPRALDKIIASVQCPVFGAFGADDHLISIEDVRRFRNALEEHNKSHEIHVYSGAPHGWLNDTMPGRYRKAQADSAWAAQQRFLREVFAGEWPSDRVRWRFESEFSRDYDFSKNKRLE